jgi:hypothetical protein
VERVYHTGDAHPYHVTRHTSRVTRHTQALLPRHMLIIFDINHRWQPHHASCLRHVTPHRFLSQVHQMLGDDIDFRILNSVRCSPPPSP